MHSTGKSFCLMQFASTHFSFLVLVSHLNHRQHFWIRQKKKKMEMVSYPVCINENNTKHSK